MAPIVFDYEPMEVHADFHRDTARERALFGAFGSGKTYAIVAEAIAWCLEQPGIRGAIIRKTGPELHDTVEPIFFEMLPHELYAAGERRQIAGRADRFTFPNGSVVLFRSMDDWNKHRSLNLGFIAYDEANEIDEESYEGMLSRVRQRDITAEARRAGYTGEITRRGVWLATNPGGHDWLYTRFVDPKQHKPATKYFTSTSFDNPYLPTEYLESLLGYPEPWIRRYVLCSFDEFGGQIYEDWRWDTHVVKPYATLPSGGVVWMGMDPGTRNPTAGVWAVLDTERRQLVGIAEYEQPGLAAVQHAASFRRIEAEKRMRVGWRVADPSIEVKDRGSNMSLHSQYQRLGYHFQLGPRTHADRIPMLGSMIATRRFVVTEDCPRTYEAIKNYKWTDLTPAQRAKGETPRETPLKKNDHLVDCAQYLSSRWVKPPKITVADENHSFSQEVHAAIRKQNRRNAQFKRQGGNPFGIPV